MANPKEFTVVKDSREQNGYNFDFFNGGKWICLGTTVQKLDTGDYSILGLEDKLCIERKASTVEMAVNFGADKDRFMEEIDRMTDFPHKFLVLEFSVQELLKFPEGSSIPASKMSKIRINGNYMLKELLEIQMKHDIGVLFCGDKRSAFLVTSSIIKRINELYNKRKEE